MGEFAFHGQSMASAEGHKTCKRFNEPGHAHALTFTCFHRQPFLSKDRTCQWLADAINRASERHRFDVGAYVFMPEHVHLLLCPLEHQYSISRILEAIKLPVTRRAVAFVKKESPAFLSRMLDRQPNGSSAHRFWQRGGGFDRNIIEPKTAWAEIDYLHANPVRRALCSRPEEWKWSSARTISRWQ
jgi:putative transposase